MITKELKYGKFTWDDEAKLFRVYTNDDTGASYVILNKTYAFALLRFIVRMGQRNWFRKNRKEVK